MILHFPALYDGWLFAPSSSVAVRPVILIFKEVRQDSVSTYDQKLFKYLFKNGKVESLQFIQISVQKDVANSNFSLNYYYF